MNMLSYTTVFITGEIMHFIIVLDRLRGTVGHVKVSKCSLLAVLLQL